MNAKKKLFFSLIFIFLILFNISSSEINDGHIRLVLHERTGSFSLFYLADPASMLYEPLLYSQDPSTSFISVNIDDRIYHLGKSRDFSTSVAYINGDPALVFESSFLTVTQAFTPVRTSNSGNTNGIRITITIQNTSDMSVSAGLRVLLDTHLGERRGNVPFIINDMLITREKIIEGRSGEAFWISRDANLSLMGSIVNPDDSNSRIPNYIHIANWRRLSNANWNLRYIEDRSFDYLPYSIGDSAVSYYYEPVVLNSAGSLTYTIYLTTEDTEWFIERPAFDIAAIQEPFEAEENADLLMLYRLREILNQFLAGEIFLNESDLTDIERSIDRLRIRN